MYRRNLCSEVAARLQYYIHDFSVDSTLNAQKSTTDFINSVSIYGTLMVVEAV
jgi:hypothetical protein